MAAHAHHSVRPSAYSVVRKRNRLRQVALPFNQTLGPVLLPGAPASVAWCQRFISPLRGESERTVLPVGVGIDALRYGVKSYRQTAAKGLFVRYPIAFVIKKAEGVLRGEVRAPVATNEGKVTWH